MEKIIFALPKGRLLPEAVQFLKKVKIDASIVLTGVEDRRLIFLNSPPKGNSRKSSSQFQAGFLIVRPSDVVSYVYQGAADIGIVGNDVLREKEYPVLEPLDLKFGTCRMVLACKPELKKRFGALGRGISEDFARVRVATKYPRICGLWAQKNSVDAQILPLYGSVEIAPLTGLADLILDLVSSGETLKQNGLVEVQKVFDVSARLIVNRSSFKTCEPIVRLLGRMRDQL
jgi:ATP phosphoribosyltransferase